MNGNGPTACLLEHDTPLACCVPGRGPRIVVTTGARDALTRADLELVLRHGQAHLRGRHHLLLLWARVLRTALPLPVFRTGEAEIAQLVEMLADDAVLEPAERRSLAHAVLALGVRAQPERWLRALALALAWPSGGSHDYSAYPARSPAQGGGPWPRHWSA